jgi:hypothetical protein
MILSVGFASAQLDLFDEEITIDIAPYVLNIASSGTVVTVHTDIAYSAVEGASVQLNGVEIAWWKSDSRGQFVAKFNMEDIEEIVNVGEMNTLTLTGVKYVGATFSGTQEISVIDVASTGKK